LKREFIRTATFERLWAEMGLGDDDLRDLENILLEKPSVGAVIPTFARRQKTTLCS